MIYNKKILTILGTRPEIIRLSRIIPKLDELCNHRVLHTGQNYDPNLSAIFFDELGLRLPNMIIDSVATTPAEQLAKIMVGVETEITTFNPDAVLILGDTNSGLSAIVSERMGVPVYHMEAGNRCYDLKVPEEKNRKIIDTISTYNLPYTELSRQNLLRENVPNNRIFVTGNPIYEVIDHYYDKIEKSKILKKLGLKKNKYIVATAHRAENVDDPERLESIMVALNQLAWDHTVVFSCHPRTREKLNQLKLLINANVRIIEPVGFFDFVKLEKNSLLAISDSGTVQEEMCVFGIPTVTIRDTTERPETVWCGSNKVVGLNTRDIIMACEASIKFKTRWDPPIEYVKKNVSDVVTNILLSV